MLRNNINYIYFLLHIFPKCSLTFNVNIFINCLLIVRTAKLDDVYVKVCYKNQKVRLTLLKSTEIDTFFSLYTYVGVEKCCC